MTVAVAAAVAKTARGRGVLVSVTLMVWIGFDHTRSYSSDRMDESSSLRDLRSRLLSHRDTVHPMKYSYSTTLIIIDNDETIATISSCCHASSQCRGVL